MQFIIDNTISKQLASNPSTLLAHPLLADSNNTLLFRWPSLLEYLGLGGLFNDLPPFDTTQPLFQACLAGLFSHKEKDSLYYIYDQLFSENICYIKNQIQIDPIFFLKTIEKYKSHSTRPILSKALTTYVNAIRENASQTMHDLILYLAWDRMCVSVGRLFDYQSTDEKFIEGLSTFKECLIESFQHITQQGRTKPSFYRLLEALFFYYMREEKLQAHHPKEWEILSQGFQIIGDQDNIVHFPYIDDVVQMNSKNEVSSECYFISDDSDKVQARITFAQMMIDKLKVEVPQWNYNLDRKQIVSY